MGGSASKFITNIDFNDFTLHRFTEVYGIQLIPITQKKSTAHVVYQHLGPSGCQVKSLGGEKHGIFFVYGKCSKIPRYLE